MADDAIGVLDAYPIEKLILFECFWWEDRPDSCSQISRTYKLPYFSCIKFIRN